MQFTFLESNFILSGMWEAMVKVMLSLHNLHSYLFSRQHPFGVWDRLGFSISIYTEYIFEAIDQHTCCESFFPVVLNRSVYRVSWTLVTDVCENA